VADKERILTKAAELNGSAGFMNTPCGPDIKTINVANIRLGFATNSSSTHSVVINPERFGEVEWPLQEFLRVLVRDSSENYRITDHNHRLVLFAKSLYCSLVGAIGSQAAQATVCEFCCVDRHVLTHYETEDEIRMVIPTTKVGGGLKDPRPFSRSDREDVHPTTYCEEYLRDLMNFLVSNKSVGWVRTRDNDEGLDEEGGDLRDRLAPGHYAGTTLSLDPRSQWVARADGPWWVLMNRLTGAKLRVNFSDMEATYPKSTLPELVDIKITDFCPYNCSFCYQGSTKDGKHSKEADLDKYIQVLKAMGTFEVAIGGGEPTLHPKFNLFIQSLYNAGIQPNFTTRNLAFFKKEENLKLIQGTGAKFAVSVDTLKAAKEAVEQLEASLFIREIADGIKVPQGISSYCRDQNPYTLQVILGSDVEAVVDILLYASTKSINVTLLGYKTTGRGAIDLKVKGTTIKKLQSAYAKEFSTRIEQLLDQYKFRISIGVDTLAIEQLPFLKGDKYRYQVTAAEGKFSMYIDAVANVMGSSSYVEPEAYVPIPMKAPKAKAKEWEEIPNQPDLDFRGMYTAIAKTYAEW